MQAESSGETGARSTHGHEAKPESTEDFAGASVPEAIRDLARDHGTGDIRVRLAPGPVLTVSNRVDADGAFHHNMFEKSARSSGTGLGLGIVQKIAGKEGIGLGFEIAGGRARVELRF